MGILKREVIGNQTLLLGDCPSGVFRAHMAGLAKSDQIAAGVCQVSGREKSERHNVVDGKAFAHMNTALGADSPLFLHDSGAGDKPASATIGFWPANPIRGRWPFRLGRAAANDGAKARHAVLFRQPRLLPKGHTAVVARKVKTGLPAAIGLTSDIFGTEGICWALTGAKLVADQMRLGGSVQESSCLPSRSAGGATEARPSGPIRLNAKCRLADFTGLFDHAGSISETGWIGNRTTLIACRRVDEAARQPDLLIPETRQAPVQEGFDL